ncbi:uncharacterized protein LOC131069121 isoform X2 [Cryptomeria japonica]|nr:uncharacterized protein LOC131069121 isoform X2 [Cryptomeria japonica]
MASSCLQKMQRAALTVFIMFVMVGSLIFCSAPVVVCILDVVLPYALLSSFRYCSCGFKVDWTTYNFGFSLVDIPFISLLRSMSILCVYSVFDAPSLSFGPYLWTALLCGIVSSMIIIVKACLFIVYSALEGPAAESRESHLKQSRGMLTILLLSLVLALGHIVVAYRIRCKVWRKMLLFHQLDPEVVACKTIFNGYTKAPQSTIAKANSGEKCFFHGNRG